MPINLPNGLDPSDIVLPNGNPAGEVRGPNGEVVWSSDSLDTDPGVIDNFEHNDLEAYYGGDTNSYAIASDQAWEGDYSLKEISASSNRIYSEPGDGLLEYPERGNVIWWYMRGVSSSARNEFRLHNMSESDPTVSGSENMLSTRADIRDENYVLQGWGIDISFNQSWPSDTWMLNRLELPSSSENEVTHTVWDGDSTNDSIIVSESGSADSSRLDDTFSDSSGDYGISFWEGNADCWWDFIHQNSNSSSPNSP